MPFVGLTLVRLLRPIMAVLYHVNGKRKGPIARFWQDSILRGFIFAMSTGKYEKKGFTFRDLRATEISTIEWQELKNRFPSFFVHN